MRRLAIVAACAAVGGLPASATASHQWGPEPYGFHWARGNPSRTLELTIDQTRVGGRWSAYNAPVGSDWNGYGAGVLRLLSAGEGADIRVANANFGSSGLLAVAAVRLGRLGHILAGEVLLNDYYYYPGSPYTGTERQVYCQELGHTIGLDHNRDGTLDGYPDDTCMNDGNLSFSHPNGHDAEQLRAQYAHSDRHNKVASEREDGGARIVVTHATPANATITGIVPLGLDE